ncbi:MAG: cyclophilin-like fold protein [bacterium]
MKVKIIFKTTGLEAVGELFDNETARAIYNSLPISSKARRWGMEIYFPIPVKCQPENQKEIVEVGDMGYWPPGSAWCIFFGPTPISGAGEIRPASAVNIFGKINASPEDLDKVEEGEEILIEKMEE